MNDDDIADNIIITCPICTLIIETGQDTVSIETGKYDANEGYIPQPEETVFYHRECARYGHWLAEEIIPREALTEEEMKYSGGGKNDSL